MTSETTQVCVGVEGSGRRTRRRGFTIVDVLVSVTVIAILTAIMLPALSSVTKQVQRVQCSSNLRQVGIGLQAYAYESRGRLPNSVFSETDAEQLSRSPHALESTAAPEDTLIIRPEVATRDGVAFRWDGIGRVFSEGYVNTPDVFYCPAHTGDHPLDQYRDLFSSEYGSIVSNYQFRVDAAGQYLGSLSSTYTLVANGLRTKSDYSHVVGNNMLKADGAVIWFDDPQRNIYNSLPDSPTATPAGDSPVPAAFEEMDEGEVLPAPLPNPGPSK